MALALVTAPQPVVTVPEAKARLRIDVADDDAVVAGIIAAATAKVQNEVQRAIGVQTWDLHLDGRWWGYGQPAPINSPWWLWHGAGLGWAIHLPLPPLVSVDSITIRDAAGGETTYPAENYSVSGVGYGTGLVTLNSGVTAPQVTSRPEAMTVRFTGGYATVPEPLIQAILLLTGAWYENREQTVIGVSVAELPFSVGVKSLLDDYRVFA